MHSIYPSLSSFLLFKVIQLLYMYSKTQMKGDGWGYHTRYYLEVGDNTYKLVDSAVYNNDFS